MVNYLIVIPARGGSKGIKDKNIKNLAGLPLVAWTIKQALNFSNMARIVVSTDDERIVRIAKIYGAEVPFIRPLNLSQDTTQTEPVMMHALNYYISIGYYPDAIILLQPTSPCRYQSSLKSAVDYFEKTRCDSLVSVNEDNYFYWTDINNPTANYDTNNRPRRQDVLESVRKFRENGSIYITKTKAFEKFKNRICGRVKMFIMTEEESVDIDTPLDFLIAETIMKSHFLDGA